MFFRTYTRCLAFLGSVLLPAFAYAQQENAVKGLIIGTGTSYDFWQVVTRIISYMVASIGAVSFAMFVVGAFMITISGVKEDYRQRGKDLMYGSILALAVVLGAYAMLRMVDFFLSV